VFHVWIWGGLKHCLRGLIPPKAPVATGLVWARSQTHGLSREHYMQGSISGKRTRGGPKTSWIDNIHSWTGLSHEHCLRNCWNRNNWQTIVHAAKAPQRPLAWNELNWTQHIAEKQWPSLQLKNELWWLRAFKRMCSSSYLHWQSTPRLKILWAPRRHYTCSFDWKREFA